MSYDLRSGVGSGTGSRRSPPTTAGRDRPRPSPFRRTGEASIDLAEPPPGSRFAQLDRALRRTIGLSPKQLLLRARLDEAMRRLDDTDLPIATDRQSECGYYDQSSFTRQFRRATVVITPGTYRAEPPASRVPRRT